MRQISSADANREFSKLLRRVRDGESVTVTSRGEPVAVMVPFDAMAHAGQEEAKAALLARLRAQAPAGVSWTRDELYER